MGPTKEGEERTEHLFPSSMGEMNGVGFPHPAQDLPNPHTLSRAESLLLEILILGTPCHIMSSFEERFFWNLIHFYREELLLLDRGRRRGLKMVKVEIDVPEGVAKFQQVVADI